MIVTDGREPKFFQEATSRAQERKWHRHVAFVRERKKIFSIFNSNSDQKVISSLIKIKFFSMLFMEASSIN